MHQMQSIANRSAPTALIEQQALADTDLYAILQLGSLAPDVCDYAWPWPTIEPLTSPPADPYDGNSKSIEGA
jgi:hypothetical protein